MRGSSIRVAVISVLLLGLLIFGGVIYAWNTATDIFQPVSSAGNEKTIPIEIISGETTAQIADDLQAKGLIRNALAFRVWARIKGLDKSLEAGIYKSLNTSMTISDIIDKLLNAQPDALRVVIPEGWRLEQIAARFASSGLVKFSKADFLKYTKQINQFPDAAKYPILKDVPPGHSMEGLLFPASYEIVVNGTARDVVNDMLSALTNRIQQYHLDTQAQQHQMNVYQMVILASLVEREVLFPNEAGGVASVYWNRLFVPGNETAGFLGSDPSVEYARDSLTPPKQYWANLADSGRNIAPGSPWNTYVNKGLPPTPICSPGLNSLQVAANPPKTDYFYFLGKKDGHIVLAKNLAEFNQDVQKYLQ
jgi:UPF0755 protein